jgi:hypothetical protein
MINRFPTGGLLGIRFEDLVGRLCDTSILDQADDSCDTDFRIDHCVVCFRVKRVSERLVWLRRIQKRDLT